MTQQLKDPAPQEPRSGESRYRRLPTPIRLEDTISTKESSPAPDPEMGRNTERDFMLRYAG